MLIAGAGAQITIGGDRPNPVFSLHQLPPLPPHFTGRDEELADLEQSFGADRLPVGGSVHLALQGMGGVGKTALAIVLAHRLKSRCPAAQLYINLRGADPEHRKPVAPPDAMQIIIHAFHPDSLLPEEIDKLAPIYHSVLTGAGPVLLFLDNASNAAQVRPLLPPNHCFLILTSRAQFSLPGMESRNVNCLKSKPAQEFLLTLCPRIQGCEAEAAQLCGDLPLALEVFAGAVNDRRLYPVSELIQRLRARQDKLDPVENAFQISYELLAENLRRQWLALAIFPASFDLPAAAAVWNGPLAPAAKAELDSARDAMQILTNASLVEYNEFNGRFRLHDLVRQFCDARLPDSERRPARRRHAEHYRNVFAYADDLYRQGGENIARGLQIFDRERTHWEAAFEWLQSQPDQPSAALLITLVDAALYNGDLRFHPRRRVELLESEFAAARITQDRNAEANALGNIGNAYLSMGAVRKAITFYEQQVTLAHDLQDPRREGVTLANLGLAYAALGETRKAIVIYGQRLALARAARDRHSESSTLSAMGLAHSELGENEKAIELCGQALAIAREIGDRRGEGNALGNLANACSASGDPQKAITFYEQLLVIPRELGDRVSESATLGNLGLAYHRLGKPDTAIGYYEQQRSIAQEAGDRRCEGKALGNLGAAHDALGNPRKAIEFYEQALVIDRETDDPRSEGIDLFNYALALDKMAHRPQAIAKAEAALKVLETIGDPNLPRIRAKLDQWRPASSPP